MTENNKVGVGTKISLGIIVLLTAVGMLGCVLGLINGSSITNSVAKLVSFALIVFYAVWGYRKPHGNLLKWVMIAYAVLGLFAVNQAIKGGIALYVIVRIVEIMMIVYMAARLDRVGQNKYIAVVILVLSLVCFAASIMPMLVPMELPAELPADLPAEIENMDMYKLSFSTIVKKLAPTIMWIDLCGAYFMRYKEHKEAGLADASEK